MRRIFITIAVGWALACLAIAADPPRKTPSPAGEAVKPVLELSGRDSGVAKASQVRVSDEARLSAVCESLKKSAGTAKSDLLPVLQRASCDFAKYDIVLLLDGGGWSHGVTVLRMADEKDIASLVVNDVMFQTDVDHPGTTAWGLVVVPKTRKPIVVYAQKTSRDGKVEVTKLSELPSEPERKPK